MKNTFKVLCLVLGVLIGFSSQAQDKFTSYENTYFRKTYPIQIDSKEKGKFTLWIDAWSYDMVYDKGGIMINHRSYQNFVDALIQARFKYEEWVKTAKENNIKEVSKPMNIKSRADAYFLYGSKWNFQYDISTSFNFEVRENKGKLEYLLFVKTGGLQSSSNQYMKVSGFALVFTSSNEINNFLDLISEDKIVDFISKPKKEALFN
jgi:hypothetical protein